MIEKQMRANLRLVWAQVTESDRAQGAVWYPDAQAIVREWAGHYGQSVETVASVVAALSPPMSVGKEPRVCDQCAG